VKYRNRHTGEIRKVVKEEDVNFDGRSTVHVFQLDDGSRWEASQFMNAWEKIG